VVAPPQETFKTTTRPALGRSRGVSLLSHGRPLLARCATSHAGCNWLGYFIGQLGEDAVSYASRRQHRRPLWPHPRRRRRRRAAPGAGPVSVLSTGRADPRAHSRTTAHRDSARVMCLRSDPDPLLWPPAPRDGVISERRWTRTGQKLRARWNQPGRDNPA